MGWPILLVHDTSWFYTEPGQEGSSLVGKVGQQDWRGLVLFAELTRFC